MAEPAMLRNGSSMSQKAPRRAEQETKVSGMKTDSLFTFKGDG